MAAAAAAAVPVPAAERGPGLLEPDDVVGEVDEELICSLCTWVLKQPQSCQAGHTFCRQCIAEWFQRSQTCPVDREPLGSLETLTRQRPLENMIGRLTVRCPHRAHTENDRPAKRRRGSRPDENPSEPQVAQEDHGGAGCSWTGRLSDRDTHLANECAFARKLCEHEGCGERVPVAELAAHAAACRFRRVDCEHCGARSTASLIDAHAGTCPEMPVECPYKGCGCGARPRRKHVDRHLADSRREHAELTGRQLKRIATTAQHKTVWTVGGIAAKVGAVRPDVNSPAIALGVGGGRTAQVKLFLRFRCIRAGNIDIGVCAELDQRADQSELLPLNFEGTEFTVEASCRSGKVSKRIARLGVVRIGGSSQSPYVLQLTEQDDVLVTLSRGLCVKVQELVGDKIVVTADWMIERKATHISTV
eukprot:COSAG02_NODE_6233_length_3709_cov_65.198892_2_plen_419_part_00